MNESGQGPKKEGGSCVAVNHKRGKAIIKEIQGGKGGKTIKTRQWIIKEQCLNCIAKLSSSNDSRNSLNTPLVSNKSLTHTTVQVVLIKLEPSRGLNETVQSTFTTKLFSHRLWIALLCSLHHL